MIITENTCEIILHSHLSNFDSGFKTYLITKERMSMFVVISNVIAIDMLI
jgi:hypothetical protein